MNVLFLILLSILQVINVMLVEVITDENVGSHEILLTRSVIVLILSVAMGTITKQSLKPNNMRLQWVRAVLSAAGILLVTQSYQYIAASSVVLMLRLDIPLIVLIGVLFFKKIYSKGELAITALILICSVVFVSMSTVIDENWIGFALAFSGTLILAYNYLLLKSTVDSENTFVIINTTAISCIVLCLLVSVAYGLNISFNMKQVLLLLTSGASYFVAYMLLVNVYKKEKPEKIQTIVLAGSVFIMFLEMMIEHKVFHMLYITGNIIILGLALILTSGRAKRYLRISV